MFSFVRVDAKIILKCTLYEQGEDINWGYFAQVSQTARFCEYGN